MDEDILEQVEPHIREILRICSALSAEGRELHELNALVGRTGKLMLIQSLQVR
jgi:ATP/maltotriose-dependent transcriptional regulator MalT